MSEKVCDVCGQESGDDSEAMEWEGEKYVFCSSACRQEFLFEPKQYVHDNPEPEE